MRLLSILVLFAATSPLFAGHAVRPALRRIVPPVAKQQPMPWYLGYLDERPASDLKLKEQAPCRMKTALKVWVVAERVGKKMCDGCMVKPSQ